jgi:hypothetical protein
MSDRTLILEGPEVIEACWQYTCLKDKVPDHVKDRTDEYMGTIVIDPVPNGESANIGSVKFYVKKRIVRC